MPRPLRVQYPGAWYHVMNRGRRREVIFPAKEDYLDFVEVLKESVSLWNIKIAFKADFFFKAEPRLFKESYL